MYRIVYVTAGNEEEATKIADTLVNEKLVACANIFPIKSVYRWKDKTQHDREVVIILKTRTDLVDEVIKRIESIHSYETPCILSIPIEKGSKKFLRWIDESTKESN